MSTYGYKVRWGKWPFGSFEATVEHAKKQLIQWRGEKVCKTGFLYRFEGSSSMETALIVFPIRSFTRKGWTIEENNGNGWRFIARDFHRRAYARDTVQEALKDFIERKRRQIEIYKHKIDNAQEAMLLAESSL